MHGGGQGRAMGLAKGRAGKCVVCSLRPRAEVPQYQAVLPPKGLPHHTATLLCPTERLPLSPPQLLPRRIPLKHANIEGPLKSKECAHSPGTQQPPGPTLG